MEIKLELDNERVDNNTLLISDKGFDSPENWINIKLEHPDGTQLILGDIRVNDLMAALIGFDAKNSRKYHDEA